MLEYFSVQSSRRGSLCAFNRPVLRQNGFDSPGPRGELALLSPDDDLERKDGRARFGGRRERALHRLFIDRSPFLRRFETQGAAQSH